MPYPRAAELLGELLPLQDGAVAQSSVRRHTLAVGHRLDERVTIPDEYDFPSNQRRPVQPRSRLSIAIDGTYIRSDRLTGMTQHYVIAGRVEADGCSGRWRQLCSCSYVTVHPMFEPLPDSNFANLSISQAHGGATSRSGRSRNNSPSATSALSKRPPNGSSWSSYGGFIPT
jgi:hypothetical protein